MACPNSHDDSFGPWAGPQCRGGLDFTLTFELSILTILPAVVFLSYAAWRLWPRPSTRKLCRSGHLRSIKLTLIGVSVATSIAFLALVSLKQFGSRQVAIGAASVDCLSIMTVLCLSVQRHASSARPSTAISLYLGGHVILNLPTARTLWLMHGPSAIAIIYVVDICLKAACLAVENVEKNHLLFSPQQYGPEELAGPVSYNLFFWLRSLFYQGYVTILTIPLLLPLAADMRCEAVAQKLESVADQAKNKSLLRLLSWRLRYSLLLPIVPRLCLLGFTLAQPFLIFTTIEYTSGAFEDRNKEKGRFLILAFVLTFVGYSLSNALYWHLVNRLMIKVRGALIALIYSSTFHSSKATNDDAASLTLMTVDVEKAMIAFEDIHELWIGTIHIGIAVYILAVQMSWACVAPILVCIICIIITIPVAGKVGMAQSAWNAAVQKRISLTASILTHLKEVRMLGLGGHSTNLIHGLRVEEIRKSQLFRQLMAAVLTISQAAVALGPFATFALYTVVLRSSGDGDLLAAQAFTSLSLITLIATPFGTLVQAIPSFAAGMSSLRRIQSYINANNVERQDHGDLDAAPGPSGEFPLVQVPSEGAHLLIADQKQRVSESDQPSLTVPILSVHGTKFGWQEAKPVLNDINLELPRGSVTAVIGNVGSGKSTLLLGILDQLPHSQYSLRNVPRPMSYCPQQPWIVSGTIRRNIVCGGVYHADWYDEVINACCLRDDFKSFTQGDLKQAGNEGSSLSGGQKQRIALARAIYARNRVLILDDPLSGVDHESTEHIYQQLFGKGGLLRRQNVTILMVTSRKSFLAYADRILEVNEHGNLHDLEDMPQAEDYVTSTTEALRDGSSIISAEAGPTVSGQNDVSLTEGQADLLRKTGDIKVYWFYVEAAGRWLAALFIFSCFVCAFFFQFSTIWVAWWSDATDSSGQRPLGYYLGIFAVICFGGLLGLAIASWTLLVPMVSRSALYLHSKVLSTVFKASASYIGSAEHGSVLNRFNQDMQLIDYTLPLAGVNTFLFAAVCLVQAIIICISAKYMAATIPLCLVVIVVVQRFYLKTSRQLRLLDIEAKSPLYTNFQETIRGRSSIRAYGKHFASFLEEDHLRVLNESQQPIYLLYTAQRWLALVLDLLVAGLAILLIVITVEADGDMSGSEMGVALVNLTSFNTYLTYLIRFWASMETSLGAISRVRSFAATTPAARGSSQPGPRQAGHFFAEDCTIEFRDVDATYDLTHGEENGRTLALSNINFTISSGIKLAIAGRSGSGKSTFVSTLLRLLDVSSGQVLIGGVDTSSLDQETVQRRINGIAQTSFFLPGQSLLENLTPFMILHRDELRHDKSDWSATTTEVLEGLGLWSTVQQRGGLGADFESASWSTGQLQLLGLARAILKRRHLLLNPGSGWKILVLDEATSSVDNDTAALMRSKIREEFADYTIISIVHRFEGVAEDMDLMIIMSKGRIDRDGEPREFLNQLQIQDMDDLT